MILLVARISGRLIVALTDHDQVYGRSVNHSWFCPLWQREPCFAVAFENTASPKMIQLT